MNRQSQMAVRLASVACLLGAGACVSEDLTLQEHQAPAIATNRIATNGLIENRVAASRIAEGQIASPSLLGTLVPSAAANEMLATPSGREYFSYIVSCALPEGSIIGASVQGSPYEFRGALGMAPAWMSRGLTVSERRWVSACLLARVNAYGTSVQISMRGHTALAVSDEERDAFGVVEGAFYGDVLTADASRMEMVACRGAGQAAGEWGGLVNRDCTEPAGNGQTVCGFRYAGDCLDYTPQTPSVRACGWSIDGNYMDCHKFASIGAWAPGTERREVVTVFVSAQ